MAKRTGQRLYISISAILLCIWLTTSATAASSFRPRVDSRTDNIGGKAVGVVTINDRSVITFMSSAGGHGPAVRAQQVANHLQALVANGLAPGAVKAQRKTRQVWMVSANGEELALVTSQEAAAHRSSSESLAQDWAATIRQLLAEPALAVSPSGITVPFSETRTAHVGGAAISDQITVQDSDTHISQTTYESMTRTLTIRGVAPGRDSIIISSGDSRISVPVVVMKFAAIVAPSVSIGVTGNPAAPASAVQQALYAGLAEAVDAEPGANVKVTSVPKLPDVSVGTQATIPVALHISGPNLLPVDVSASIVVQNTATSVRPLTALFYSNNPEQVKSAQALFVGRLHPTSPVRLDYHHQSSSAASLIFHVDVVNISDSPVSVHVISGLAIPGLDTVQVGRRAGATFMAALDSNIGLLLQIPPHTRVPLVTQRLAPALTVSGIVQMQQTAGPDNAAIVQVATDLDQSNLASPVGRVICAALPDSRSAMPLPDQPTDYGVGTPVPADSPYIFPNPDISLTGEYAAGGKWAYIRIGKTDALKNATGDLSLWGNYGASYSIDVTLANPTASVQQIGLFFAPEAGLAAGVLRIDGGAIQEFDPIGPPAEPQIAKYSLAPGEKRVAHIETIPLNGSSYPVSIIAHAL